MPSKKTTRRSVSLKGSTFRRIYKYCAETGISVSGYLEELIRIDMETKGRPVESPPKKEPSLIPDPEWGSGVVNF